MALCNSNLSQAPNEACPGWGESAEELLSFRDENAAHRFDQLEEEASEVFDDVLPEYYMLSEVFDHKDLGSMYS